MKTLFLSVSSRKRLCQRGRGVTVTKTTFLSGQIQTRLARPLRGKGKGIKLMNEREAVLIAP